MKDKELVRRYEPVLRFAKGENFFPMKVEDYVAYCSLLTRAGDQRVIRIPPPYVDLQALAEFYSPKHYLVYADQEVVNQEEADALRAWIGRQATVMGPDFRQFLKGLADKVKDIGIDMTQIILPLKEPKAVVERAIQNYGGIAQRAPIYYYRVSEDKGYAVVQYWFFYAYNDFASSHGGVNDHEADWECVHLFFKGDEPVWVALSSHGGHGKRLGRPWESGALELDDGRPVIYVAAGSHANYYTSELGLVEKKFAAGEVAVGGSSGLPWVEPESLDEPWFTEFKGRWGTYEWNSPRHRAAGRLGGSPTGPKFNRDGSVRLEWGSPAEYAGLA